MKKTDEWIFSICIAVGVLLTPRFLISQNPLDYASEDTVRCDPDSLRYYIRIMQEHLSIVSRDQWQARGAAGKMKVHHPDKIMIHHTGMPYPRQESVIPHIQNLQRFHQEDKKWADIAYHYLIDREGNVYEGRNVLRVGDTATKYDPTNHLLICLVGNYEVQHPCPRQLASLFVLISEICRTYHIDPVRISGHRDYARTACPGKNLYRYIKDRSIYFHVRALLGEMRLCEPFYQTKRRILCW
jgi:hypothetical protein